MDIEALFAQTLDGDYDDDAPWKAVSTLRDIGSREVFDKAASWCRSEDFLKRARGADVLAQLGRTAEHPTNCYPEESFAILENLAKTEENRVPLSSAIHGLGHVGDPRAVSVIAGYNTHSKPEVRFAVACACGSFGSDHHAVEVLLKLMRDADSDVRDWATFGVGSQSELDGPEIREALASALNDSNADVRQEALVGLSRRKDLRILPILFFQLKQPTVDDFTIEAASWLLDLPDVFPDWEPNRFIAALNERFGQGAVLPSMIMPE